MSTNPNHPELFSNETEAEEPQEPQLKLVATEETEKPDSPQLPKKLLKSPQGKQEPTAERMQNEWQDACISMASLLEKSEKAITKFATEPQAIELFDDAHRLLAQEILTQWNTDHTLITRKSFLYSIENKVKSKQQSIAQELLFNRIHSRPVKEGDYLALLDKLKKMSSLRAGLTALEKIEADREAGLITDNQRLARVAEYKEQNEKAKQNKEPQRNDIGNAELFADCYADELLYIDPWHSWLNWNSKQWEKDTTLEVMRKAKRVVHQVMPDRAILIKDEDKRAKYYVHIGASHNRQKLENMVALAKPDFAKDPMALDTDDYLFNCQNGTIELKTGQFRAHNKTDLLTKISPVSYDADAQCPTWLSFLTRIFRSNLDVIPFLQRAIGYSLTGEVKEEKLFFCYGTGQNGKSTLLNTLAYLMGDYGLTGQASLLVADPRKGIEMNGHDVADLFRRRFVCTIETGQNHKLNESKVKSITTTDKLTGCKKYENPFEFNPTHKIWVASNFKPNTRATELGFWRRIDLIPFTETITEEEKDRELGAKLKSELPGILNWALAGLKDWQASGLREPQVVVNATNEYRDESDLFGQFLAERITKAESEYVFLDTLFNAYLTWTKSNGIDYTMTAPQLTKTMLERGFTKTIKGKARKTAIVGCELNATDLLTTDDSDSDPVSEKW